MKKTAAARLGPRVLAPLLGPVLLGVMLASALPAFAATSRLPSSNVAWISAAADADIDRAFAQARSTGKPVLLYWGATWCPPCNQLKATLFNRQDFAAQARSFVAVAVDGDLPGAQKLGQRFKVTGYPTMVIYSPAGAEITRLPGGAEPEQVLDLMRLGMAGGRPVRAVLADALAGRPLQPNEWRLLAYYGWEIDNDQIVTKAELPGTLARLAAASPASDPETSTRLWLKALAASGEGQGVKADAALRERVQRVITDPAATRRHMDVIGGSAADLVRALAGDGPPEQSPLVPVFDAALQRLTADTTLSRGDRQVAMASRVELARLGQPRDAVKVTLPEPLLKAVRESVARDDREITDGYERQAVITTDAYVLSQAGLWAESDALLKANLAKSHSPYYLMSDLADNAKQQGRTDEALRWYGKAFDTSVGPATRLQWGSSYLRALLELAPADGARIEKTASQLIAEAAKDSAAFEGRSARSLQRASGKLVSWNADGKHTAVIKRLQARLDPVCGKLAGEQRDTCQALLKPAKPA